MKREYPYIEQWGNTEGEYLLYDKNGTRLATLSGTLDGVLVIRGYVHTLCIYPRAANSVEVGFDK